MEMVERQVLLVEFQLPPLLIAEMVGILLHLAALKDVQMEVLILQGLLKLYINNGQVVLVAIALFHFQTPQNLMVQLLEL